MNAITEFNMKRYNNDDEFDIYSKWKNHRKRIEIMLDLVDIAFAKSNKKDKKKFRIIDIGGNTGVIAKLLKDRGYSASVADMSAGALKTAKSKGLRTYKFDFNEKFDLKDNSFDVVVAGEIIEHVLDTERFLNECNRILKDDGFLVLSTPNLATFHDRVRFLFGKMPRQINPYHERLKLHIRPFTYKGLKEALDYSRFKILKFRSNYFTVKLAPEKPIFIRCLALIFPTLSSSLIVLAKKVSSMNVT